MKKDFKALKKQIKLAYIKNRLDVTELNPLLMECMHCETADLFLKDTITFKQVQKIKRVVSRRINGEPLNKIFKKAYFYGLEFYINRHVLAPRQETEILVNEVLKRVTMESNVLDLCTGSGCIAISIASKGIHNITASDKSLSALRVAKKNAKIHHAAIHFVKSDLFGKIKDKFDLIVSNPPYIPTKDIKLLDREVKQYDPKSALDGGKDGLKFYRAIIAKAKAHLTEKGCILFEVGQGQSEQVQKLLKNQGFKTTVVKDYSGIKRVVIGEQLC